MTEPVWSVPLPADAEAPIDVYVNSVKLAPEEFDIEGRWIRVRRPINLQPALGFWRRVMLGIGIGVYGDLRGDQVDLRYRSGNETRFVAHARVIPPQAGEQAPTGDSSV